MSPDFSLQLLSQMMWVAAIVAGPLLIVILVVGVFVNVIQVVTQIQEMSLSFIPKLIAGVAVLTLFGGWMLRKLLEFCIAMFKIASQF